MMAHFTCPATESIPFYQAYWFLELQLGLTKLQTKLESRCKVVGSPEFSRWVSLRAEIAGAIGVM
jgi:hypothetical protein